MKYFSRILFESFRRLPRILLLIVNTFVVHGLFKINKNYVKSALSGLRQFLPAEGPLKMTKNTFYFTSKALFVLKIFKFLFWQNGLIRKIRLILNFITSQPG